MIALADALPKIELGLGRCPVASIAASHLKVSDWVDRRLCVRSMSDLEQPIEGAQCRECLGSSPACGL